MGQATSEPNKNMQMNIESIVRNSIPKNSTVLSSSIRMTTGGTVTYPQYHNTIESIVQQSTLNRKEGHEILLNMMEGGNIRGFSENISDNLHIVSKRRRYDSININNKLQSAGCGCSGNDEISPNKNMPNQNMQDQNGGSQQPINYNILVGGKQDSEKHETDENTEETNTHTNTDEENTHTNTEEDEEDEEEENEEEEDEEDLDEKDEESEEEEITNRRKNETTEETGISSVSQEIIINTKPLYSENAFGSDNSSEYQTFRNKSM
jgi:hypothetical protein